MSEQETPKSDSSLLIRRIINAVISFAVGVFGCYISVYFILGTTWGDYGNVYIFFTVLSIACGVGIWLDHERVLNTKILPH